jgi:hypothetical protein
LGHLGTGGGQQRDGRTEGSAPIPIHAVDLPPSLLQRLLEFPLRQPELTLILGCDLGRGQTVASLVIPEVAVGAGEPSSHLPQ